MSRVDLGRVRGSLHYVGSGITGRSTVGTVFADSGVSFAYEEDLYFNFSDSTHNGNVYQCVLKGAADVAKWVYVGCILGAQPVLVNNLTSDDATKALTAKMGKRLSEKIDGAGIYPYMIIPSYTGATATISLLIENKDSTITLTDREGESVTYAFSAVESSDEFTRLDLSISPELGFEGFSAYIVKITSNNAKFSSYKLVNSSAQTVEEKTLNIWDSINTALQISRRNTGFVDGDDTYYTGLVNAYSNSGLNQVYPVSHVEAIYYSISGEKTLKKYLEELEETIEDLTDRVEALEDAAE